MKPEDAALKRCPWAGEDPLYVAYHDTEWGVPLCDDRKLFEFLLLEGAQAGLSWITILRRREAYRSAFAGFDPLRVAAFTGEDQARLLNNSRIIRNRRKIASAISNARVFLRVRDEEGSFARWLWNFVEGEPITHFWETPEEVPAETPLSRTLSKEMKRKGFSFVGPVICYSFMQAVGMVNDHLVSCFRHRELREAGCSFVLK